MKAFLLTTFAMLAFAANSIIGRMALIENAGSASIDAASYTSIRLLSGAFVLLLILVIRKCDLKIKNINSVSALMLFTYAVCFSFSYINIATGTGALILFGSVQLTMILSGIVKGDYPGIQATSGTIIAFSGLIYLLLPGVSAPPLNSALLMAMAGIAWGIYSLRGRGVKNPLIATSWNFIGTLPLVLITTIIFHHESHITSKGMTLAILSGALASGMGYAIWYTALPYLSSMRAATVQLTVPVIASIGGVILLSETVSLRLVIASIAVLGGVYLTIKSHHIK
ncbi:MAG: DMT family transporter [Gammaproteobacteria bacterium]|nr:DMT family transporter [Gammaproteobacteria bacterium]